MNRDRRALERRPYRLWVPRGLRDARAEAAKVDASDVAPWVIAGVRCWSGSVDDGMVAAGLGVGLQHVQLARESVEQRARAAA